MPNAVLQTSKRNKEGNQKIVQVTRNITHNTARLYHAGGRTYEYIGDDRAGQRIYRDTQPRG